MNKYRADIDGLRAVAVVPIVLFHAGYEWVPGGFIGVDIFFVISGYLISSIILGEMLRGDFSFIRFYERRVRRIVPALLVMLLATLVAGYFFLLPDEYIDLAKSTLSAIAFVPNIYFSETSSTYFGLDAAITPILHTWSLGVEEQFYILFPAILYALTSHCSRKTFASIIVTLLLLSLASNIIVVVANPEYAFYMLPTRAWELLTGVILSLGILPRVNRAAVANLLSLTGAGLLLFPMFTLTEHMVFPGINAIPPVLGAALIIYSGEHQLTAVSRILGNRGLVAIGLVSYSLYLWHWPVTVYTNMYLQSDFNRPFIIALSLGLAWLSYRLVESRFRKRSGISATRGKLKELGIVAILASIVSATVVAYDGIQDRVPPEAWKMVSTHVEGAEKQSCRPFSSDSDPGARICEIGRSGTAPDFVVWGDSHAEAVAYALHLAASEIGISGVVIFTNGCRPLLGVYRKGKHRCQTFNDSVLQYIYSSPSLKHVFLAAYWRIPFTGQGYDNHNFLIMDDQTLSVSAVENRRVFRRGMERTLRALKEYDSAIIQDIPEIGSQFGKSVTSHFVRQAWLGNGSSAELTFETGSDPFDQEFDDMISSLTSIQQYIQVTPSLCFNGKCPLKSNGKLVYSDGDHLSKYGASLLAPTFTGYFATRTAAGNEVISLP